jgi:formylglycine-generating enzyme required for sulfatase activity
MQRKLFHWISLLVILGMLSAPIRQPVTAGNTSAVLSPDNPNSISGRVTDRNGNGIEGTTIRAVFGYNHIYLPNVIRSQSPSTNNPPPINPATYGGNFYTTQTDANGNYTFDGLPVGSYFILAFKDGVDFNPLSYIVDSTIGGSQYNFEETVIPTNYSPIANPLSENTTSLITSISADGTTFTFSTETPELGQVNVGEVIIGGTSVAAPDGFLRKVTSKQLQDETVVLVTEPATLEEAFESLSVNISRDLTQTDFQGIEQVSGLNLINATTMDQADNVPITFMLDNFILDKDGNPSTTADQIVFNGFIALTPHMEARIRIENAELKEYYQNFEISIKTGYTVSSSSVSMALEKTLLPVPLKVPISAVPLINLSLDFFVGVSGSISGSSSTSITNTSYFTQGFWYSNGQKQEWNKFVNTPSYTQPASEVSIAIKAYVGAKLDITVYDFIGPYIKASLGMKNEMTLTPIRKQKLQVGLEITGGIAATIPLGIFKIVLFDYQFKGIEWWYLIYSYPDPINNEPYQPTHPSPPLYAINQGLSIQLGWDGGDPNGDLVLYDIYFNAGISNPSTKVADHQSSRSFNPGLLSSNTKYYWKVVSFDQHGLSTASPVWNFTTGGGATPPLVFNKTSPTNGATNQPINLTLDWGDSSGATSYAYCYDTTNDNACSNWVNAGTTSQATISGLANNTTYYWQVRATNTGGTTYANGSATAYWSFTTGSGTIIPGEMVTIPEGEFQMGCHPEHNGGYECWTLGELPLHSVLLDTYYIDKYEVTNGQYALCVNEGACNAPFKNSSDTRPSYFNNPDFANFPVIYVSWYDANDFCSWAGKRLPTEAEWEKAARGTTLKAFPWGDESPDCYLANHWYYDGTKPIHCIGDTNQVGSYPTGASPYGVMDMAGNVYEWINDWYDDNYYSNSPYQNPLGPDSGEKKGYRSGSLYELDEYLRVASRPYTDPYKTYGDLGFRCAASLEP